MSFFPTHLVLLRKELEELFEDLHVKPGGIPSPDHSGDLLVGAGEGEDVCGVGGARVAPPDVLGTLTVRDSSQLTAPLPVTPGAAPAPTNFGVEGRVGCWRASPLPGAIQ